MSFVLDDFIEELRALVNVDCGTFSLAGNAIVVDLMAKKYTDLGFDVKKVSCDKAGVGLEIRNKPEVEHIDVMMIGHLDTVFPEGTVAERPMTIKDGIGYGPGIADMKAGLLAATWAIRGLDKAVLDKLSICFCMNPDEEIGSVHSSSWLVEVAKKAKYVLVAEPSRGRNILTKARKGMAKYTMNFHGKPVHAGNDLASGRSAITEMAHWVHFFNSLTNFETGTTFNVGVAKGGTVANVVAEFADIVIDTRYWDNDDYENVHNRILEQAKTPFVEGVKVTVERQFTKPSMNPNDNTIGYMNLVEEAAKELGVDTLEWIAVGGLSDGNTTASLGIPTLDAFGPTGGALHSADEFLELDTIEFRIQLMQKVLTKISAL